MIVQRMSAPFTALVLTLLGATTAAPALAQPAPPTKSPPPAASGDDTYDDPPPVDEYHKLEVENAQKRYQLGAAHAKKGEWEKAYLHFIAAWDSYKHWYVAMNLGTVEVELGRYSAARKHLIRARDDVQVDDWAKPIIQQALERATAAMGTLQIHATSNKPADVLVDGERVGTTPFSGPVLTDPGEHEIEVKASVHRAETKARIESGVIREVRLELAVPAPRSSAPAPPPPAAPRDGPKLGLAIGLTVAAGAGIVGGALLVGGNHRPGEERDALLAVGGAALVASGVAAAGAGMAWYFFAAKPTSARESTSLELTVTPVIGPAFGGLSAQGQF